MNTERHSAEEEKSAFDIALQHIMTAEEYSHVEHETPHVFKLTIGGAEIHYFGSPHSRDPQDPLFKTIEDAFNEAQPDLVFVEGITIPKDKAGFTEQIKTFTREGAIDRAGEAGFALKLATEKGIDYHCPEPSNADLYNDLLRQGFSQDEIFTWEVFHTLPQYNRQQEKNGFKEYSEPFIEQFKNATHWEGFDYSYERAIQNGESILGRAVDVENEPDALDIIDPIPRSEKKASQTVLNRVDAATLQLRDRTIVTDIVNATKTHQRIFVVYGASHAVMQEPALRMLAENEVQD